MFGGYGGKEDTGYKIHNFYFLLAIFSYFFFASFLPYPSFLLSLLFLICSSLFFLFSYSSSSSFFLLLIFLISLYFSNLTPNASLPLIGLPC